MIRAYYVAQAEAWFSFGYMGFTGVWQYHNFMGSVGKDQSSNDKCVYFAFCAGGGFGFKELFEGSVWILQINEAQVANKSGSLETI